MVTHIGDHESDLYEEWATVPDEYNHLIEQALQVIEWYKWRWRIKQLFATLKQARLNLEATQERISPSDSKANYPRFICCSANSSNG